MPEFMTTLFGNIKIRARYISDNLNLNEPPMEDENANDLAQAICEEMERLTVRIEKIESKLNSRQYTGPTNPYDCSRRRKNG